MHLFNSMIIHYCSAEELLVLQYWLFSIAKTLFDIILRITETVTIGVVMMFDAPNAFDRVEYIKVFTLLVNKGLCPLLSRKLAYMYTLISR